MPYFIYKVFDQGEEKVLNYVAQYDAFVEAKAHARSMRTKMADDDEYFVKIMFAASREEAQARLLEKREPPVLKEWEK